MEEAHAAPPITIYPEIKPPAHLTQATPRAASNDTTSGDQTPRRISLAHDERRTSFWESFAETTSDLKQGYHQPENQFSWGDPLQIFLVCWPEFVGEFMGTLFFVFFGTASVVLLLAPDGPTSTAFLGISFAFGFCLSGVVWILSGISHAHINPAITLAILVLHNISVFKAIYYVISQIGGGLVGSALVLAFIPAEIARPVAYGATLLAANSTSVWGTWSLGIGQGFFIEFFLTFFFVFCILATSKISPSDQTSVGKFAPLAIGFALFVAHCVGVQLTGCSLNPARSLGPAVISGVWTAHYIYWAGPLGGAVAGALVYRYVFQSPHQTDEVSDTEDDGGKKTRRKRRRNRWGFRKRE